MENKPIVLIMCGGRSLRLWPLSEYKSKNFIDVFGFSPLELTIKRFLKITSSDNIFLVANKSEKTALKKVKIINQENIIFEPESKNTAAAILLALTVLNQRYPKSEKIIISPVDNLIKKENFFYIALKEALSLANRGFIATLGLAATKPTANFGYIQTGKKITGNSFYVKNFIEKPSVELAKRLIKKGNYFYNGGMFISSLDILFGEYEKYYKGINNFKDIAKLKKISPDGIAKFYKKLEDIPFDKAIMEKTGRAAMVKINFLWKDFGNWQAIQEILPKDYLSNAKKGKVFIKDGKNNLIYLDDPKKKILVMGLSDTIFVTSKDYILLTHASYLDKLKTALQEFKAEHK